MTHNLSALDGIIIKNLKMPNIKMRAANRSVVVQVGRTDIKKINTQHISEFRRHIFTEFNNAQARSLY